MQSTVPPLTLEQLIDVFSFTKTAVAVHVGEEARIEFANKAMLAIWGRGPEIKGKALGEALPELSDQPFIEMFAKVWREGITISGIDTPADLIVDGILSTYYFDFEYRAIKDVNKRTIAVLHTANDVTERYLRRHELEQAHENKQLLIREQSLNQQLELTNKDLNAINEELLVSKEQLAILNTKLEGTVEDRVKALIESEERFRSMADNTDILISVSNEAGDLIYLNRSWMEISGRTLDELIIGGWHDMIYHMDRQTFFEVHERAFAERTSYSTEIRLLGSDGLYHWLLEKGTPRFLNDGTFAGYISSCVNITQIKKSEEQLQNLNEELEVSNQELAALIGQLAKSNEELMYSENRFRNLIRKAPVAICVIRAEDLIVTEVNDVFLKLVGKSRELLEGQVIWEGVPETAEVYSPLMQQVIKSGKAFHASEHRLLLNRKGSDEIVFVDFVYEPLKDLNGTVTSIMIVGNDVTDKVVARKQIENIEERSRLAIEASEIGTFELNYADLIVIGSKRFDEIFEVTSPVSRARILETHHPLDAEFSEDAHELAQKTGKLLYDTRIVLKNNIVKWIRLHGNLHYDSDGRVKKLLGTVVDITAFKQLQQQKDDFISIASHELKTPLTSLKVSLQLLDRMKMNPTILLPRLIDQSNKSIEKISELVEELLNVTRIREGKVILNKKNFNVTSMIEECCSHFAQLGTHDIVISGAKNLNIFADENRIQQVIINLVNNAIKYAPVSRQIFIDINQDIHSLKVSVRDNGEGIPADKLPYLFDRYYRVNSDGMHASGLGLGLYISADIIERHGGKMGVESLENVGSTFWFTLPYQI